MVFDPNDRWGKGLENLFSNGVGLSATAVVPVQMFGHTATHTLSIDYSSQTGTDLSDSQILLPDPPTPLSQKSGFYSIAYQYNQFFYENPQNPNDRWGMFFRATLADGNPNIISYSILAGLAGSAPWRPQDSFGLGYFYYGFSGALKETFRPILTIGDEQGVEMYYKAALTPWLNLTTDFQIISPAIKSADTAYILGFRLGVVFELVARWCQKITSRLSKEYLMSLKLSYAFTIFFVTLGPIKTIPGFVAITADLDRATSKRLAIRGTLVATAIVFATALIFSGTLRSWEVSLPAMQLAGGLLLFSGACASLNKGFTLPPEQATDAPEPPELSARELNNIVKRRALSPLAVPTIVTPVGIAAILVFLEIANADLFATLGIYGLLILMMVLNLVGMWFAQPIVRFVGFPNFQVIGWIFSVLQAG
ncbi:MAG: hypothetical protein HC935_07770 [Pseudanabaena sp. SU_2_4]|nr:hypothetical protein [Pseudanabaena sp. SU_2_4]